MSNIFVHCRIKPGGALNVLEALIQKKIQSGQSVDVIFTLYSDRDYLVVVPSSGGGTTRPERSTLGVKDPDQEKNSGNFDGLDASFHSAGQNIPIITALPRRLNNLFRGADRTKPPLVSSIIDYRNLMLFFPELMKILSGRLHNYVLRITNSHQSKIRNSQSNNLSIIISSYAVAKNIDTPPGIHTEIYFHQPMHYIWTLYDEYVGAMNGRKQWLYKTITPRLRKRDTQQRNYDTIYCNSESTKSQIEDIYFSWMHKKPIMQIIHPPIEQNFFHEPIATVPDNYFFYINRLTRMFKHLDKIILLCNRHQIPLLIAGDGPDKEYLMSIAGPTITFLGRVSNIDDKIALIKKSRGILNIAHESFGIVTAEALLLGVPVFGYHGGATPELVDKNSGILTPSIDMETMSQYFSDFVSRYRDRQAIQERARSRLGPKQAFWREKEKI